MSNLRQFITNPLAKENIVVVLQESVFWHTNLMEPGNIGNGMGIADPSPLSFYAGKETKRSAAQKLTHR